MNDVKKYDFQIEGIMSREDALLFQDWFLFLSKGRINISGQGYSGSGKSWNFSVVEKGQINITFIPERNTLGVHAHEEILELVKEISNETLHKITKRSITPGCWWSINFTAMNKEMDQTSLLHMLRNLGTYKRGPNKLRLASSGFLEIKDETGDQPALFPKLNINASILSPGAAGGPFSKLYAEGIVPTVCAVLSTCFGTPLAPGPGFFPVKEDKLGEILDGVRSNEIPELGFQGMPIWGILQNYYLSGANELADRLIGAMMAYEAGMLQRTDHATLLFFVSAIEALTVPNLKAAQRERLSKRFSYFLEEFCAEEMEKIMAHLNFEQAFGKIKNKKKFANQLYNLRSQPVHTGHFGNYFGVNMANDQTLKVGLVNDLVIGAIAALIRQPVSLLWGHPELDHSLTLRLDPEEHHKFIKEAKNSHKSEEDYLKCIVLKDLENKK